MITGSIVDGSPDRPKKGKRKEDNNWAEWVYTHVCRFSDVEIGYIMEEVENPQYEMTEVLKLFADGGLKTSFKYNRRTDQYELRLFRDNPKVDDAGYALVVQAQSFERCLAGLLFAIQDTKEIDLKAIIENREAITAAF